MKADHDQLRQWLSVPGTDGGCLEVEPDQLIAASVSAPGLPLGTGLPQTEPLSTYCQAPWSVSWRAAPVAGSASHRPRGKPPALGDAMT
jgi:hypothetical protein